MTLQVFAVIGSAGGPYACDGPCAGTADVVLEVGTRCDGEGSEYYCRPCLEAIALELAGAPERWGMTS